MSSRKRINFKLVDAYKRIFGNLHVPVKFVVPKSAEWPTEFHGYNIGKYIGKIRSRGIKDRKHYVKEDLHELDAMGLDWVNFTPKIQKVSNGLNTRHCLQVTYRSWYAANI